MFLGDFGIFICFVSMDKAPQKKPEITKIENMFGIFCTISSAHKLFLNKNVAVVFFLSHSFVVLISLFAIYFRIDAGFGCIYSARSCKLPTLLSGSCGGDIKKPTTTTNL